MRIAHTLHREHRLTLNKNELPIPAWRSHWANCDCLTLFPAPDMHRNGVSLTTLIRHYVNVSAQGNQFAAWLHSSKDGVWSGSYNVRAG